MSNLPPGVSPSMIPGNRPEDHERENLEERLLGALTDVENKDLSILVWFIEDGGTPDLLDAIERGYRAKR